MIRRVLIAVATVALFVGCSGRQQVSEADVPVRDDGVEVIYFHGTKCCKDCEAMGRVAKELVELEYGGRNVGYEVVNFTTPEGEYIANRYEISYSSLIVSLMDSGEEQIIDLTKEGFAYGNSDPQRLRTILRESIDELLAQKHEVGDGVAQ